MSARAVVVLLLGLLLLAGGAVAYVRSTASVPAVAEDCEDKPPPPNEFAMAAECEAGEAPASAPADAGSR